MEYIFLLNLQNYSKICLKILKNSPLRQNANLEAVGNAALYLLSDSSSSTTGEIIYVDGGYHVMGLPQIENI